ncbi:TRAP transporter small permease [Caproiciproducens sp. NJN-50]|uniref:TRAP transporter small permease n=1 Tax=Caproiciproducens sp. NJN-50 TaxID=2507162 RepID=UPI000FFDFBF3|nr:TRAP transporter small permease [Caproiciproducens sp. NJN-50]QAT48768.1 TRAP transporter small permease [Caproiciproducens sp. NJN-50]
MSSKKNPLTALMNGISYCCDFVYRILLEYSKVVLLVIVLIVSAQVVCRKFLGFSIAWSEEVSLLLMVWMAFISMAIGVEKHLHIGIELFFKLFPKPFQKILAFINNIVTFLFGIMLIVYGVMLIQSTSDSTLPATQWPASSMYLMIPAAGFFICYYSLIEVFHLDRFRHRDLTQSKEDQ